MKLFLTIFGAITVAAVSAYAGGLADSIVETGPVVMNPDQSAGSAPDWVVPVVIIALLAGAAVLSGDGDDSSAS